MASTEVVVLKLKPEAFIGDPANPASQILKDGMRTLAAAPGAQAIHFGTFVESQSTLQMFIDWDDLTSFQTFLASPPYATFLQSMLSLAASKPSINHVPFTPTSGLASALAAPVTEIATFYIGAPVYPPGFATGIGRFLEAVAEAKTAGYLGGATGLTVEDVELDESKDKDGSGRKVEKGKGAMLVMGWESIEAHMAFRETAVFEREVGVFRRGVGGAELHHTVFMRFVE